jgi:hypothetical protein
MKRFPHPLAISQIYFLETHERSGIVHALVVRYTISRDLRQDSIVLVQRNEKGIQKQYTAGMSEAKYMALWMCQPSVMQI